MLGLGEDAENQVTGYAARHLQTMPSLAEEAYKSETSDFPICRLHPLGRLAVIIWKLTEIRRKYAAVGASKKTIDETFGDISLRQRLYFQKTGRVGLTRADCFWLRHLARVNIFKLGVLQYQPMVMTYLEKRADGSPFFEITESQKARLPEGTPVLNVHIQHGANLGQAQVTDSLQAARRFFSDFLTVTQFGAMVCFSWMLHSGLRELLPADSRILQFAANFEVVSETPDNHQAVERIFGRRYRRKADYPQQTSLQRAALRDLSKLGFALGIIYLDFD